MDMHAFQNLFIKMETAIVLYAASCTTKTCRDGNYMHCCHWLVKIIAGTLKTCMLLFCHVIVTHFKESVTLLSNGVLIFLTIKKHMAYTAQISTCQNNPLLYLRRSNFL
jgi:hypothetical protein